MQQTSFIVIYLLSFKLHSDSLMTREELVLMLLFYSIKLSCSLGITQSIGKHHEGVVTVTVATSSAPWQNIDNEYPAQFMNGLL